MATTFAPTTPLKRSRFMQSLDNLMIGIAQGYNAYVDRQSRLDQINALHALSDDQLAAKGLRRDEIARYVFRDLYYI